jgi:hypothetical protein
MNSKSVKRSVLAVAALASALGAVAFLSFPVASAQMGPSACQCASTPLYSASAVSSYINNCQCGAMQCVALANQSLQCK